MTFFAPATGLDIAIIDESSAAIRGRKGSNRLILNFFKLTFLQILLSNNTGVEQLKPSRSSSSRMSFVRDRSTVSRMLAQVLIGSISPACFSLYYFCDISVASGITGGVRATNY